ncbi:MAG: helix-turn-helix domain-containing protein [Gammaproteobacteria bacterium]|nr:helix-turn-helix domain-containing protein [Gammaproteobacteria bacterium]
MSAIENPKFGSVLKAAREEKNISIGHVSEALKLSLEKIESIEASDLEALPAAAFTCGYLRLFAKLVELDEEEVIHLYNQSIGVELINSVPGTTSDLPTQASSGDLAMRIVTYSLGLVAVVLFVIWLQGAQEKPLDASSNSDEEVNVLEESVVHDEIKADISTPVVQTHPEIEIVPVVKEEAAKEEAAKEEVAKEEEPAADEVSSVEEVSNLVNELVDVVTEEIKRDEIIALANEANPVASSGTDVVVLTANDDCWVEVSDANQQLLYFSLLKKGEVAQLKGQEPFSMFLGKAKAVVITLNDIEYDISRHVRSNQIARFIMSMDNVLEKQVRQDVINNSNKKPEEETSTVNGL